MMAPVDRPQDDAAFVRQALSFEGGHLFVQRGSYTLHTACWTTRSGFVIEPFKARCVAAGLVVIDTRRLDPGVAFRLTADTPMVAGTHPAHPADPPPWTGTMWAPLQHVAAAFRAGGAEVLNLDDGAARPDGAVP